MSKLEAAALIVTLLAVSAASYYTESYEVHPMLSMVDDPSLQCCKAGPSGICSNISQSNMACDDNGVCYCCPNGGGIKADFGAGTCTCGYKQSCTDLTCKNVYCSAHGYCSNGTCVCDYAWSGSTCTSSSECCTSPKTTSGPPSFCQLPYSNVNGQCDDETGICYCCPYPAVAQVNYIVELNMTLGHCKCHTHVIPRCADPGKPKCDNITCGQNAACSPGSGHCGCAPHWNNFNPATNSCNIQDCVPTCGMHGTCDNGTCDCKDGFSGPTCKDFQRGAAPPAYMHTKQYETPRSVFIIYAAIIIPSLVLFLAAMATLTNKVWRDSHEGSRGSAGTSTMNDRALPRAPSSRMGESSGLLEPATT